MDKIICEICGTSYPDSASQCPICGYAKPADAKAVPVEEDAGAYQHVRGGRFSSDHVRRKQDDTAAVPVAGGKEEAPVRKGSNFVLGIIAIILLLVFIGFLIAFIGKILDAKSNGKGAAEVTTTQKSVSIVVEQTSVEFLAAGESHTIAAQTDPVDELATFVFASTDPGIAMVDETGTITAVAPGETKITVMYEDASLDIWVVCNFEPEPTYDPAGLKLKSEDVTFDHKDSTWIPLSSDCTVPNELITWRSDDESVAIITDGVVKVVGAGKTTIYATYKDVTVSCVIRGKFEEESEETENGEKKVSISHTDVTLSVDESFKLTLIGTDGNALEVTWTAAQTDVVTIDGNKITGVQAGSKTTVSTTYEGQTYKCTVRVRKAQTEQ